MTTRTCWTSRSSVIPNVSVDCWRTCPVTTWIAIPVRLSAESCTMSACLSCTQRSAVTSSSTARHSVSYLRSVGYDHELTKFKYLYQAPESWRRLNGSGRSRTGCASSVPARRRCPTGPVTIVLVADGSVWLVPWLQNFVVQLQSGRAELKLNSAS